MKTLIALAALLSLTPALAAVDQTIGLHKALPHNKPVLLDEGHCRYLEDLNRQYAGVALSAEQQEMRQQLVAWYVKHCRKSR